MARTHKEVLEELLKDPEFKQEYEALEPEFALQRAILLLRKTQDISQQQLAEKLGTKQAYISRIERQPLNLSIVYLARLFDALNADIELRVVPRDGTRPIKVRLAEAKPARAVERTAGAFESKRAPPSAENLREAAEHSIAQDVFERMSN